MGTKQGSHGDLSCVVATTTRERSDNQRVRFEVFARTTYYDGSRALAPREADELDALFDTTTLLNVYSGEHPVGAARLLLPNEEVALHNGWEVGLPIEARFMLGDVIKEGPIAEGGRFCVVPAFWGTRAASILMAGLFTECRRRGVRLIVACANAETDSEEDARIQARVLSAKGLYSERLRLAPRTREDAPSDARRPFYSPLDRQRAAQGDLGGLRVPRTLTLYAKFGARFVGEPVYDARFGLHAFPLVLPVPAEPSMPAERSLAARSAMTNRAQEVPPLVQAA